MRKNRQYGPIAVAIQSVWGMKHGDRKRSEDHNGGMRITTGSFVPSGHAWSVHLSRQKLKAHTRSCTQPRKRPPRTRRGEERAAVHLLPRTHAVERAAVSAGGAAPWDHPPARQPVIRFHSYCQHFSKNDFLKKLLKSCKWQGAVIPSLLHGCDQRIKLLNVGVCVGLPSTGGEGGNTRVN